MKHRFFFITTMIVVMFNFNNLTLAQSNQEYIITEPTHGIGYLPLYISIDLGLFDPAFKVKVLTIETGSGHTGAVLSGQAFAFIGGPEHDAFAKLKGAELRAVVNIVDRGNVYFVAQKGIEPQGSDSLETYFKGKTIGVGPFGGTPNSITRFLMKKYGLEIGKDVFLAETATSAVIATVRSGQTQIGNVSEPLISRGIKEGLWGEPFINIPKDLGPYAYSVLNVRLDSVINEPQNVQKFVDGIIKGLSTIYDHPDLAIEIAKKEFPTMNQDELVATINRSLKDNMWSRDGFISKEAWNTARSVVMDAGILTESVAYDDIIDMEFVTNANVKK